MGQFWSTTVLDFFIALGVVLGGSVLGGIGALLTNQPPMDTMWNLADQLKIWALVAALGGTFDTIRAFEVNILGGELNQVGQQFIFILSAFIGAHTGTVLIRWLIGEPS
ncbi:YtrH family sporulation protein [Mechercharimyces sp. CAU 1602]|uniref:YtrH family sporulation protein n=1 Tax=Mechercharimyces sp. CAU 1602 TaxID=2973933 RepID=UPI0021615922|nr:YtrH family sporulation protein [Mechercharimyces sp. CAU 1602]MCS1351623.1 YtrH family sporulation protein [Mechercharimyces sp. CAU 1602]